MTSPAPGWYPDPGGSPQFRWWDGSAWSAHTSAAQPPPGSTETWLLPVGRPWQAIVAGYSGLLGLVIIFLLPVSLGFGIWGLYAISKKPDAIGKGRCWFGIASGVWNLIAFGLIAANGG